MKRKVMMDDLRRQVKESECKWKHLQSCYDEKCKAVEEFQQKLLQTQRDYEFAIHVKDETESKLELLQNKNVEAIMASLDLDSVDNSNNDGTCNAFSPRMPCPLDIANKNITHELIKRLRFLHEQMQALQTENETLQTKVIALLCCSRQTTSPVPNTFLSPALAERFRNTPAESFDNANVSIWHYQSNEFALRELKCHSGQLLKQLQSLQRHWQSETDILCEMLRQIGELRRTRYSSISTQNNDSTNNNNGDKKDLEKHETWENIVKYMHLYMYIYIFFFVELVFAYI
ncbi:hypothetical protein RFI_15828 [Reticulomyxa filosa]|uniref:Uncharacterized protein n=1 Tax=Reticulomyxa filosa TaxID=46433 RepID=X6N546_RETFI|nr:hypothetical protein RFI_15828 [Reticulomyxa filosa]|eukprot:ETO21375.1 hypothetical protein RFI_15828 [Reticulomyxa filosa]